jgi:hypothetical protein
MHEAEEVLDPEDLIDYAMRLEFDDTLYGHLAIRASAAQRAEAFLRTLNLWTDSDEGSEVPMMQAPVDKRKKENSPASRPASNASGQA